MREKIRLFKIITVILLHSFLLFFKAGLAQNEQKAKMKALSFMIGDWVGTSTSYDQGLITDQVPAFQKISYDLDSTILVVELHSQTLQLHTIIYYDETEGQYYYYPFSKEGVRKLPAANRDGKFVVNANPTTRFVFSRTSENGFQEYGEKLVDGQWEKYFEDNFTNTN